MQAIDEGTAGPDPVKVMSHIFKNSEDPTAIRCAARGIRSSKGGGLSEFMRLSEDQNRDEHRRKLATEYVLEILKEGEAEARVKRIAAQRRSSGI